jgi:peptide/nickel transport system permease protein
VATPLRRIARFARRKPLGAAGALIFLLVCVTAALAPVLAPHDPLAASGARLEAPSMAHWMGTDEQSRDVLSRVIYGAQLSLKVGTASIALATVAGTVIGLISGFFGGVVDFLIQRVIDVMLSIPVLILAIALVAVLGTSTENLIIAIAVGQIPSFVRVVRSSVLVAREQQYVSAAQVVGATDWRVMFRHVLPNVVAPIIVLASAGLGFAILSETSLSFLGLGPPITEPSWGAMLSGPARIYMPVAPWLAIFPGIAISLVVFGANMLGDALRDEWDPRLRSR